MKYFHLALSIAFLIHNSIFCAVPQQALEQQEEGPISPVELEVKCWNLLAQIHPQIFGNTTAVEINTIEPYVQEVIARANQLRVNQRPLNRALIQEAATTLATRDTWAPILRNIERLHITIPGNNPALAEQLMQEINRGNNADPARIRAIIQQGVTPSQAHMRESFAKCPQAITAILANEGHGQLVFEVN